MIRRTFLSVSFVFALVMAMVSSAFAAGAGAVSYTQIDKNVTDVTADFNPCSGAPGTLTQTYNDIFHVTELTSGQGAGTDWATGTMEGTLTFVPSDPALPTYTGHFTVWFGGNDNLRNGNQTFTFSAIALGSDGSMVRQTEVGHLNVSATGVIVSFDKQQTSCT